MLEVELDERSRRNDRFDEANSVPVKFLAGTFHVPKPWVETRPVFEDGKVVRRYRVLTCGRALDELIVAIGDAEDFGSQISAVATLAAYLLRWHYDLTDSDLDRLLAYRNDDSNSMEWLERVMDIATGRHGPKRASASGG